MRRLLATVILLGCALPGAAEVIDIDNQQLKTLIDKGVPLVDVRTPKEWRDTGVVKGSQRLMFFDERGRFDINGWLAELAAVAKPGDPVILICRSGNRSAKIAALLSQQAGYTTVYNVKNGIKKWLAEGNPTHPQSTPSSEH
jgi:rhodanese-related sulfurtransferase